MTIKVHLGGLVVLGALLGGCGQMPSDSLLLGESDGVAKTRCPGDHQGFYVCEAETSKISSQELDTAISQALAKLVTLVNSTSFEDKIDAAFTSGTRISKNLSNTDYIVEITGYCDPNGDALAKAVVGGDTINYNECIVQRDASGNLDVAEISGVLLHEISHNIGYTHPDVDPSRLTIPYYLGDLAEAELGGSTASSSSKVASSTAKRRTDGGSVGSSGYYTAHVSAKHP